MITSVKNTKVKEVRALQSRSKTRRETGSFAVEGTRLCEEAAASGWPVQLCLYTAGLDDRTQAVVTTLQHRGVLVEEVAEHVMEAVSDTQTPQGVLLVMEMQTAPLPTAPQFVLILDQVGDPGNAGTLLRTAAAAGADAVWLTEGSVDPFSPKVVRAGMGAHFHLPVATYSTDEILAQLSKYHLTLWSAAAGKGQTYTQANLAAPSAVVIGSEAQGVSAPLHEAAQLLHIPMPGKAESLNAAVAGAVLIFEHLRQKSSV